MMRKAIKAILLTLLLSSFHVPALAATCSCAGVPLLTSIDTSASEPGDLFINYSTEDHQISDLVSGSKDVRDETRRDRTSFSQVVSASYAITDRWSISALVSHIEHKRTIGSSFLGGNRSSGFGDSVILARYTPLFITPFSRHEVSLGLGVRIATGEDNAKNNGITLSEDMHPSTGALGKILWASYGYAFNQASTVQFNASANYTYNDENDRKYSFGDEFNFAFGLSQSIGTKFGYSAAFRYRSTRRDRRLGFQIPNTGGKWLDFVPAVQYAVSDNLTLGLNGRIPVARDLNDALQFTTSYSFGVFATYGF